MPMIWILLVVLITGGYIAGQNISNADLAHSQGQIDAISGNILIYRNSVTTYAESNPTVTGAIADASLGLPSWFRRVSGANNYVAAGKGYVYYSGRPDLASALFSKTEAVTVGIKRSGVFVNPTWGTTSITLPSAIPGGDREKGENRTLSIHPGSSEVPENHGHSSNLVDTSVPLYMIASERETSGLQRQ